MGVNRTWFLLFFSFFSMRWCITTLIVILCVYVYATLMLNRKPKGMLCYSVPAPWTGDLFLVHDYLLYFSSIQARWDPGWKHIVQRLYTNYLLYLKWYKKFVLKQSSSVYVFSFVTLCCLLVAHRIIIKETKACCLPWGIFISYITL